jgi:hypothetical protein
MKPRHALGVLSLAALVLGASPASGAVADEDSFAFAFTTAKAKSATGYSMDAEFPTQRIIDRLTITLPRGTKVDTGAGTECGLTQDEYAGGRVADQCPAKSMIGTGTGTAFVLDSATPTTFDLEYYNLEDGALIDILANGEHAFVSPVTYRGRKQVIDLSLAPSINARITAFSLDVERAGTAKKPVFRTPGTCPKSRKLAASITAREAGAGSVTTRDTSRCKR